MTPAIKSPNQCISKLASGKIKWNLWGESVVCRAKEINKPICVFVHNNASRWSHAMMENFSGGEITKLMNEDFVPVLADCCDAPQLALAARASSHMMVGHAGWPLILFITPDKKPIFASAYMPKSSEDSQNPGLLEVLRRIKWLWLMKNEQVVRAADGFAEQLSKALSPYAAQESDNLAEKAAEQLISEADMQNGGFGVSPKFPYATKLLLCSRLSELHGNAETERISEKTLDAYISGAMYDHVGGGFFDYCSDVFFRKPYLGKHLAQNAAMLAVLENAYSRSKKTLYKEIFEETFDALEAFGLGDGLYCSGDDISDVRAVGEYYLFGNKDILSVPENYAGNFFESFEIVAGGNYSDPLTQEPSKKHLLYFRDAYKLEGRNEVKSALAALEARRRKKTRPPLEKCVRIYENAYLAAVLARASASLGKTALLDAAIKTVDRVLQLEDSAGLCHCVYGTSRGGVATLDDFACLALACLEIYSVTGEKTWLDMAIERCRKAEELFGDGAMSITSPDASDICAAYDCVDGDLPSGNGIMANVLISLCSITGEQSFRDRACAIISAFGGALNEYPASCAALTIAALRR